MCLRRSKGFGTFFATVSIVAEGAPFNQETARFAVSPSGGQAS